MKSQDSSHLPIHLNKKRGEKPKEKKGEESVISRSQEDSIGAVSGAISGAISVAEDTTSKPHIDSMVASRDSPTNRMDSLSRQTDQFIFTQSHYMALLERAIRVEEETKRVHEHIAQLREDTSKETAQLRHDMSTEITHLRHDMNTRTEAVDKRFEAVDKRFEAVDKRFDDLIRAMNNGFRSLRWAMGGGLAGLFTLMMYMLTLLL